jgi:hypothetical protein
MLRARSGGTSLVDELIEQRRREAEVRLIR